MLALTSSVRRLLPFLSLALALGGSACKRAAKDRQGDGGAPAAAVPVVVEPVRQRDIPLHLLGLGTVSGFYTATVRARVDGLLDRVHFREGDSVRRGQLLAELDARPYRIALQQAEATLARDAAQLKNARLNLTRNQGLRADDLVSQQAVDDLAASVDQLAGTLLSDQAGVDNARLQLEFCRITAPIDGRTGIRQLDPGNLARASDANGLVVLTQLDPIAVIFTLPEDNLASIARHNGQAPLQVQAVSRDGSEVLGQGTLALIDNQINTNTGTLRLKAIMPNPQGLLWPNQFVKVRMLLETVPNALVLPAAALQRGPEGTFVYVVDSGDLAQVRPVTVRTTLEEWALIEAGVGLGDRVVVEGQQRLKPGSLVQARRSDAAAPAPAEAEGAVAAPARP